MRKVWNGFARTCALISVATSIPARATGGLSPDELKFVAEHQMTPPQVILTLALANQPEESLRGVYAVLNAHPPATGANQFRLKGKQLNFNGIDTGLRVVSADPLNLEYRGRSWRLESNLSAEESFKALAHFIDAKRTVSMSPASLFFPAAEAKTVGTEMKQQGGFLAGFFGGMWGFIGAGLARLACVAAGGLPCVALTLGYIAAGFLSGGAVGGTLGAASGYAEASEKQAAAVEQLNALLATRDPIKCDDAAMTIGPVVGSVARVRVSRADLKLEIIDAKGNSNTVLDKQTKGRLRGLTEACKDPKMLADLNRELASGVTQARQVILGQAAGGSSPATAPAGSAK